MLDAYAPLLTSAQIGEEVNVRDNPALDGWYPDAERAVVHGVVTARQHLGSTTTLLGTNTTMLLSDPSYYQRLVGLGGQEFVRSLNYIGLDAFPDVFAPAPPDIDLADVCRWVIASLREQALHHAGLDHLDLHITEHGWPTGPGRGQERQAVALQAMLTAITDPALRVTSYTHFSLRDATDDGSLFGSFGLLDSSYQTKPAFHTYAAHLSMANTTSTMSTAASGTLGVQPG